MDHARDTTHSEDHNPYDHGTDVLYPQGKTSPLEARCLACIWLSAFRQGFKEAEEDCRRRLGMG